MRLDLYSNEGLLSVPEMDIKTQWRRGYQGMLVGVGGRVFSVSGNGLLLPQGKSKPQQCVAG